MAGTPLSFTYDVIENGPRDFIFTAVGVDTATTVAYTSESTITGIIAAAVSAASTTYTPSVHNKVRRIIYNTANCFLRLQWHQTTNADMITLTGYGDWNMDFARSGCQGLTNPNGAGSSGDIDVINVPIGAVSSGSGIITGAASLMFFITKGV